MLANPALCVHVRLRQESTQHADGAQGVNSLGVIACVQPASGMDDGTARATLPATPIPIYTSLPGMPHCSTSVLFQCAMSAVMSVAPNRGYFSACRRRRRRRREIGGCVTLSIFFC